MTIRRQMWLPMNPARACIEGQNEESQFQSESQGSGLRPHEEPLGQRPGLDAAADTLCYPGKEIYGCCDIYSRETRIHVICGRAKHYTTLLPFVALLAVCGVNPNLE